MSISCQNRKSALVTARMTDAADGDGQAQGRIHAAIRFQYTHPDAEGWQKRLMAHIGYLQDLLKAETLRASGPLKSIPDRPAMLIISAPDRQKLDEIISEDPFAKEG